MGAAADEVWSVRKMARVALFIALSVLGGWIVFPSPLGTVALDSVPGYFLVLFAGQLEGGLVLTIGHLLSAFKAGVPLGPIHLLIAVIMFGCGIAFYQLVKRSNAIIAVGITTLLNGVVANLILIPLLGTGFFLSMSPVLSLASLVNISLAYGLYSLLKDRFEWEK